MLLSSISVASRFVVITENTVQALLWLIMVFLLSGFWMLMYGAEFIAVLYFLLYIGAVAVLFLFVVMFLNFRGIELDINYTDYYYISIFIGFLYLLEVSFVMLNSGIKRVDDFISSLPDIQNINFIWLDAVYGGSNLKNMGEIFFLINFHYFFLLGYILLGALLGSIVLLTPVRVYFKKLYKKCKYWY